MPKASGAAGRVDLGVEGRMQWTPHGPKKVITPAYRNCDSYLLRYQAQMKKNKSRVLQGGKENPDVRNAETDGAKGESSLKNRSCEAQTSARSSGGKTSKKSKLCVIL